MTANPSSSRSGWIAVAATICIWTGFILVSRAGGKGMLTGWDVAGLRFGVGGLIALFFLGRVSLPPLKVIALFSVFGGIGYAVTVYSAFRLALAGIVLTAADTLSHGARLTGLQLLGDALFLCGSSAWAAFTLLLRRYPMPPLAATVATTLGSAVVYLPLFLPSTLGQAPAAEIALQAVYQGVLVVFVAMLLYTFAVRQIGAQPVALMMAVVPGLSALAAVPVLGEPLSLLSLAGLAAVTAGAVMGARQAPKPAN